MLDVIARDESVQHIVASFPTDVFSGVRTDRAGKRSIELCPITYGLLLISRPTFAIDSSRKLVLASSFYSDLNADFALSTCRLEPTPRGWDDATLHRCIAT